MTDIGSSSIRDASYDEGKQEMTLTFSGNRKYIYRDVSKKIFDDLCGDKSSGLYFHNHIKGKYPFRKHDDGGRR